MGNPTFVIPQKTSRYRGRLAPSPTGYLHLGHARTFWIAQARALNAGGTLILRNEDLDPQRCKPVFVQAMLEDLRWFGLNWSEGPDCGGHFGPYKQSERIEFHRLAFQRLQAMGCVYPCFCSRKDIQNAAAAPHPADEEPIYPGTCRPTRPEKSRTSYSQARKAARHQPAPSWRFRVSDGQEIRFVDGRRGPQHFLAGRDFGDFVIWRHDDVPAYQLAVVVDDAAMKITEVVRGEDLLLSTARQLLLYASLQLDPPAFYHCPILTDSTGARLAKRHAALSLRTLRAQGIAPETLRQPWEGVV